MIALSIYSSGKSSHSIDVASDGSFHTTGVMMGLFNEKMTAIAFSSDARCLLKITRSLSPREVNFADGTRLLQGDSVVATHLWNDHLPSPGTAGLSSHVSQLRGSLAELASYLQTEPELIEARAIYAEMGFLPDDRLHQARRVARQLGFDFRIGEQPRWNPLRRAFWRNTLSWWFLRKHNPAVLKHNSFGRMRRCEVWMSRSELLSRYGGSPGLQNT